VAALFEARTVVNIVTPCVVVLGRFNKGVNIQQSSASTKKSVDDIRRDELHFANTGQMVSLGL
jgi:hypothetical protein